MRISYARLFFQASNRPQHSFEASSRPQKCQQRLSKSHFEASATRPQDGLNMALNDSYDFCILAGVHPGKRRPWGVQGRSKAGCRWGARNSAK